MRPDSSVSRLIELVGWKESEVVAHIWLPTNHNLRELPERARRAWFWCDARGSRIGPDARRRSRADRSGGRNAVRAAQRWHGGKVVPIGVRRW